MSFGKTSLQDEEHVILQLGSHLTWDELKNIEKNILKREENILRVRRVDFETLPTYFSSIRNLFGYILYRLEEVTESLEVFKDVLQHDPLNLNAVNNLIEIYNALGLLTLAKRYKEKLEKMVQQKENTMITRALCDKAHAIRHFQQDCRDFTYMPYLCQAIAFGANINTPERGEWLFDYGLALFRRDFQLVLAHASSEESDPNFVEAIHTFYDVIQVKDGPIVYKALSWVFMGILLRHDKTRKMSQCFPNHPDIQNLTSIECIERGLKLSPENEIVTRRVASEFSRVGQFEEASRLFEKSLAKEKSWFAFRHQGLMYLKMYDLKKDRDLLLKSEDSFKSARQMKDVHADHSDLGYVYFLLGPSYWDKALERFHSAKNNDNNDNFDTTETYRRMAECLKACGEEESANLHLQLAQDIKNHFRNMIDKIEQRDLKHGNNCHGNECERYHAKYCDHDRPGFINIKSSLEMPYKTRFLTKREETKTRFRFDFFLSFCHIDHKWAVALLKRLENDFNLIGCLRYRDYRLGISIMENIITSIEESYKTIIIISPDSLKDNWCKFETDRAAHENIHRDCIVPLILRVCETPKKIRTLCRITCESGQIHEYDWIRLSQELKYDKT